VFLSNGKITAVSRIELENIVVKGSQPHNDFLQCDSFMQGVNTRTAGIRMLAAETDLDMLLQNSVSAAILPMGEKQTADKLAFLQQHPASAVNPWLIWSLLMGDVKTGVAATLQSGYAQMPAALQNSETGVKAGALLTEELKAVVGGRAPAFEQPDTEGHLVSLASFTGKYLLLDFWSSTNPAQPTHYAYLKQAYAAYKSKGLEVLSVSLDKDSAAFKTGLQAFRFAWGNIDVFNEKGASVALLYGISVPLKNVLIGPDGTIVAKNISASKMGETLAALLD
jgi:peroxiredoxin